MTGAEFRHPSFWKFYKTASGSCPVKEYLDSVPAPDRAAIEIRMEWVRERGTARARHVRGEIYEVRVAHGRRQFRILFATDGRHSQVLLAVEAFTKKTQRTPPDRIELAEQRLREHRARGSA